MTWPTPMTPEELERRLPVWDAMSDAFLDTETRWGMPRIALVLAQSGYSTEDLEAIWQYEIVPECASNLFQIAGEWTMFVVDVPALAERAEGKKPLLESLFGVASPTFLGGQWRAILAMREALLALPEGERAPRAAMWTVFVHVYIEASLEGIMFLETHLKDLRATGASEHELREAFEAVRPTLRGLLLDERKHEAQSAANVHEVITRAVKDAPRNDAPR
jgi:hypothetical protein